VESFSVNQLFRKAILSCYFIAVLLILGTDLSSAHDVQPESMGHHIYVRLSSRSVAIDYALIQTGLADMLEILAMNADRDSSITGEEKDKFFRSKASDLFNHLNITLNNTPLDFELISMFCSHAQTRTFYYKADIPNGIKSPYELIARSGFPCSEDENFLYYIQTLEPVCVLNMDLSGAALPVKARALHDPPVLKVNFNTGICDKGTCYKEPVLVSKALAGEEQKIISSGQIPFEPVSGIEKLKKIILSEKAGCRIILIAMIMAMIYGGLHALTPGHGKTLVAAYLVGTQGRIADAVILGIVTTFTHTFSVIILGLITLFASKYILPQQLLPFLQLFSGLLIVGIGTWLMVKRIKSPTGFEAHGGKHAHTVPNGKKYHHSHEHTMHNTDRQKKNPHNHELDHQVHEHSHDSHHHTSEQTHFHDHHPDHNHAHRHHNDETRESGVETGKKKTGLATLISLGFSGGMVPCPDALILLLLAIAIDRITFGLFILVAFSFGLAFVLITIGILMVTAQPFLERFSGSNILRVLPALSCSIIIGIGLFMVIKSVLVLI